MKVILPVAGKGTRLRPHTHTKPKSLVRVAGKTVLQHVMDSLKRVQVDECILITDANGAIIEEYVHQHFPGMNATFIRQEELPLQVDAIAEGSEEEFKNNQHLYGVKRICNAGYGYWQYAVQSTLS